MTCAERRDLIMLHAADLLEGHERAELQAHLESGCPRCIGEMAAAEATLGLLPLSLPPATPGPAVRQRLMERAAASRPAPAASGVDRRPPTAPLGWRTVAVSAVAAILSAVLVGWPLNFQRQELMDEVRRQSAELASVRATLQQQTQRVRVLMAPQLDVITLAGAGPQPDARGRIFWDRSRGTWDLYAARLEPVNTGRSYQLWFVTADQRKVSAGVFTTEATGEATLSLEIPEDLGQVMLAAVTEEPAGGSPQPTGDILLLGQL